MKTRTEIMKVVFTINACVAENRNNAVGIQYIKQYPQSPGNLSIHDIQRKQNAKN
jgi:hypothetical protein